MSNCFSLCDGGTWIYGSAWRYVQRVQMSAVKTKSVHQILVVVLALQVMDRTAKYKKLHNECSRPHMLIYHF